MRKQPQRFAGRTVTAVLCAVLLLPAAATAGGRPSLASTSQYRAFVEYVKRLDSLVGRGATAAQKATYESELTAKLEAANHKANALFKRGRAETEAKFKEQQAAIRRGETEAAEALDAEFAARVKKAAESYRAKLARVETGHRNYETKVNEQIASLRAQKAQASDVAAKNAIQKRITAKINELRTKRQEESKKRAELKSNFRTQKSELHAAERKQQEEIQAAADAKVRKSAKHWKQALSEKEADLDAKRDSQLAYLTAKAEKGRTDIGSMPAAS
jgi:hypothetical protein